MTKKKRLLLLLQVVVNNLVEPVKYVALSRRKIMHNHYLNDSSNAINHAFAFFSIGTLVALRLAIFLKFKKQVISAIKVLLPC